MSSQNQLKEYVNFLVKEILLESKQNLMNIGYPEIVASILVQKFGKNAFLIAKWMKEYYSTFLQKGNSPPKDWWMKTFSRWFRDGIGITDVVNLYNAAQTSEEEYNRVRKELDLFIDPEDDFDPTKTLRWLSAEIAELLFKDIFFYGNLIEDIMNKKLTNLQPYKKLSFQEAKDKYDKMQIFNEKQIVKKYKNGWKWINVGKRCQLVGGLMKNCGSAGVMSMDPDRTMIAFFDPNNKPHIVVTYSPGEKRISGDEGQASTAVKSEYHDYVLDLAEHLGAEFDIERTKSKMLKLKGALRGKFKDIEQLDLPSAFDEYFKITLTNGDVYYTDTYTFIPEQIMQKLVKELGSLKDAFRDILQYGRDYKKEEEGILSLNDIKAL